MPKRRGGQLTEKERLFCEAFIGRARGNATKAAQLAGYGRNAASAATLAWRLLRKVEVQRAIIATNAKRTHRALLDADQTDRILSSIADDDTADMHARIRAIGELNKVRGRHSIKHIVDGHVTLEMLLAESRGMKLVGGGKT